MRRSSLHLARVFAPVFAAAVAAGCANAYAPLGGPPDREPPYVVATEPEAMSVVPDWKGPVVIRFNERISERGIQQSVTVSPETGEVEVKKGRRELRISLKGGWQPGRIYRIVVHPVVQDLFGNKRLDPVDLVFSTGAPIPATTLAGEVLDRITGKPVRDARVEAVHLADSAIYVAVTDTAGLFALRHIPSGEYTVRAFVDQIPNRQADFTEPFDSADVSMGAADTTVVQFALLPGDTTAARVTSASAPDSTHVRIRLDDYLDPTVPLDSVRVELYVLPDTSFAGTAEAMHGHEFQALVASRKAASDSAAAPDSAAARGTAGAPDAVRDAAGRDLAAAGDSAAAGAGPAAGAPADTALLPVREFVAVPAAPLPPETRFLVRVEGIRNIHGLSGGGGSAEFTTPARPAPKDTTGADTIPGGARPDTIPAATRPDTLPPAARPDTIPPGPRPDSILPAAGPGSTGPAARPDTLRSSGRPIHRRP